VIGNKKLNELARVDNLSLDREKTMTAPKERSAKRISLLDVIDRVTADFSITESARAKRLSAIKSLCKWTDEQPNDIPATTEAIRSRFRTLGPAYCGVSRQHMNNVRSLILGALRSAKIVIEKPVHQALSPCYAEIYGRLKKSDRIQLGWVIDEASRNGLEPCCVGPGLFDLYEQHLKRNTLRPSPGKIRRAAQASWTQLIGPLRENLRTNPTQTSVVKQSNGGREDINPEFIADLSAFLKDQSSDDIRQFVKPSARDDPLRPATIDSYSFALKRAARTLQSCGHPRDQISSLSYVTQVPHALDLLERILQQPNNPRFAVGNIAAVLATVAKNWVGQPEEDVKTLRRIANRWRKGAGKGLANRNQRRVSQFRDQTNLAKLFLLPRTAAERLNLKRPLSKKQAREMMLILAIFILTYCPLRIRTITQLRFEHILWSQPRMRGHLSLELNGEIIKNHKPASYPLAEDVAEFLRRYLKHARPVLAPSGSPFLFPQSDPERPLNVGQLSTNVKKYIFDTTGLDVTPHIFRHLVHIVVLRRFPGAYALVARVCGHEDLNTTLRNYATEDAAIAMEVYQNLVAEHVDGTSPDTEIQNDALAYGLNQWIR